MMAKKAKGTVFVEHIKIHLEEMFPVSTPEVVCKICDLNVDDIYEAYKRRVGCLK